MAKNGNIYLIGPMGSGKTAVGRELARRLKRRFVDTDSWIEREAGAAVSDIFARRGEKAFRALERRAVRRAAGTGGLVVALGGGAPTQTEVRRVLLTTGITVRLTCSQRDLWRRVAPKRATRPLLKGGTAAESRGRLAELLRRREGRYPKGDLRVSTSRHGARAAARRIAALLAKRSLP